MQSGGRKWGARAKREKKAHLGTVNESFGWGRKVDDKCGSILINSEGQHEKSRIDLTDGLPSRAFEQENDKLKIRKSEV